MEIKFQLAAMALEGSRKGQGKATATAKMPTSVINWRLFLDLNRIKGFISEDIHGLIRRSNVCGIKDEWAWDLFYDIIFLDSVTTRHCSQFQLMWPHRRRRSSPFREWWAAFRSYMGQMFDKTHDQMNIWRWDNHRAYRDRVNRSNLQTTRSGKVNALVSISLGTVVMISGQRSSLQAAGSASQATSWPLDHWIGMR